VRDKEPDAKGWSIMRRSRQVLVAACGMALTAATSVPVFAQTQSRAEPGASRPAVKIQANNFRFCKASQSSCSTTNDTNFKAHALIGQKIKWIYRDQACDTTYLCPGHNVKFAHKHKSGTTMTEGAVIYTTVFHNTGTYEYFCTHHKQQGMTGRIVVTRH
jgi:plastocyanin